MVIHWLRHRATERTWHWRLAINAGGALATGVVTGIIAIAKFDRGAWVIVVLVPLLVLTFLGIHRYYERPRVLLLPDSPAATADLVVLPILTHLDLPDQQSTAASTEQQGPRVHARQRRAVARSADRRQVLLQELAFAAKVAPEIVAVQVVEKRTDAVAVHETAEDMLPSEAKALSVSIQAIELISPYRTIVHPLANFIRWHAQTAPKGTRVAVLLPCETHPAWWTWPLRRRVADRVRKELERDRAEVVIVDVPFTLSS
jgi:hypothetical protein